MMLLNALDLAKLLGGEATRDTVLCPGPNHSSHDRSLSVTINPKFPEGFIVHSFDPLCCRDYVRSRAGLPKGGSHFVPSSLPALLNNERRARIARSLAVWREGRAIAGTVAETYLRKRCGDIPSHLFDGEVLRYVQAGCYSFTRPADGKLYFRHFPMLLALMRCAKTNEPCGVHRTALADDGSGKAEMPEGENPKRMIGVFKGSVIKLTSDDDVCRGLNIAEGIETAISIMNTGNVPMWVAGSDNGVRDFPVLNGIECLTVWADADTSGAGQRAAVHCCLRWASAGREAVSITPDKPGTDFNDIQRAG